MKFLILVQALCLIALCSSAQQKPGGIRPSIISTKKVYMNHHGEKDSLLIPVVSSKYPALRDSIDKNIFFGDPLDSVKKNYEKDGMGITEMSYEVTFENKELISLKIYYETMGAHPDSQTTYLTFDIATGKSHSISREINAAGLKWIYTKYKADLKRSVAIDRAERKKNDDEYKKDPETYNGFYQQLNQSIDQLTFKDLFASYVFTSKGILFTTEYAMPHVVRAIEPGRDWLIPYAKLKIYKTPNATILK